VEEEVISKIPCGWEEEWKAFHSEKSSKKLLFPNLFTKGGEAPENLLVSWLFEASSAQKTPSIDIWGSIFGAYSCKRSVLRKISKNLTANDFSFPRSDRSEQFEDLRSIIFTDECLVYLSVPGNCKNDGIWAKQRSKLEPIQKFKFAPKIMVWGAMTASYVSKLHVLPPNQTVRAKYIQESILSLFLPEDMNKTGNTGKVTERRFMKTCWIWHCCWTEHQFTRPQKLKIWSETIVLSSKSKTNDPQTCLTCLA
jgi:hypothetical protein